MWTSRKVKRVVLVGGSDAISVIDQCALAFGVVINVGDKRSGSGFTSQVGLKPLQQVRFVITGPNNAVVGRGNLSHSIKCVILSAAVIAASFERYGDGPIQRAPVLTGKLSKGMQQVAFEIVFVARNDARLIEHLDNLGSQIVSFRVALRSP